MHEWTLLIPGGLVALMGVMFMRRPVRARRASSTREQAAASALMVG